MASNANVIVLCEPGHEFLPSKRYNKTRECRIIRLIEKKYEDNSDKSPPAGLTFINV
jgi:hypothetical protein